MSDHSCPNCGTPLSLDGTLFKMATCPSCETTLFINGQQVENAGESGTMHDAPQLITLGKRVRIGQDQGQVMGHARFDYGPGWWDEYWVICDDGTDIWVSVDEGDVIVQHPLAPQQAPRLSEMPTLGTVFHAMGAEFRVIEVDQGTCVAVRGQFGEVLRVGERFDYVNCQSEDGTLLSGEFADGEAAWFTGTWCDPFKVEIKTLS